MHKRAHHKVPVDGAVTLHGIQSKQKNNKYFIFGVYT